MCVRVHVRARTCVCVTGSSGFVGWARAERLWSLLCAQTQPPRTSWTVPWRRRFGGSNPAAVGRVSSVGPFFFIYICIYLFFICLVWFTSRAEKGASVYSGHQTLRTGSGLRRACKPVPVPLHCSAGRCESWERSWLFFLWGFGWNRASLGFFFFNTTQTDVL